MLSEKIKYFLKDYKLPLRASAVFIVILVSLLLLRTYERSVLADILGGGGSDGKDYAKLLSSDKVANLEKHSVNETTEPDNAKKSKSSSGSPTTTSGGGTTTTTSGSTTSSGSSSGSGSTSGGGSTGTTPPPTSPPPPTAPPAPFTATVLRIYRDATGGNGFNCTSGGSTFNGCTLTISLRADVATNNGPGNVSYMWHWNWAGSRPGNSSSPGGFSASSGNSTTNVQQKVVLTCMPGETFPLMVNMGVTSPNQSGQSMSFPLYCGA